MATLPLEKCIVAEFVGTFFLVLTVGCNKLSNTPNNAVWGGVSVAGVLMVAIYALGGLSGGNFNPAVSLSIGISGKMPWSKVCAYIGAQLAGGLAGASYYYAIFGHVFALAPSPGFGMASAGLCETLYTFMLCFVVLNVACAGKRQGPNEFGPLAIGFVIIAGAYGAGAISGGCFNPAVAFAIDTSSMHLKPWGWCVFYTGCEFIGAGMAAVLFRVVRPEEVSDLLDWTPRMPQKLMSEFIGTFMLVLTVGLNVLGNSPAAAFSIAAALMSMIYALGDVSGANFNPAVTLAIFASGRGDFYGLDVLKYMVAQLLGGITAAFVYSAIYSGRNFALGPMLAKSWSSVMLSEFIFTFLLCYTVLCTAVAKETSTKQFFGLAIGMCVTVGGLAIGSVSGGSLNPAVSTGIAARQTVSGGFVACLVYSTTELLAGVAAAVVLRVTHGRAPMNEDQKILL